MPRNLDLPLIPETSEDPSDDVPKSFSVMMTQCHSVSEVKCVNLPRTVQETIHEKCSTEFDQECSTMYKQQCTIGTKSECQVVNERKCATNGDQRECDKAYDVMAIMFSDQNKFRKEVFLGGVGIFLHVGVNDVAKIIFVGYVILLIRVVKFIQCGVVKVILKGIVKIKKES